MQCCIEACKGIALYVVGKRGYCSAHRKVAVERKKKAGLTGVISNGKLRSWRTSRGLTEPNLLERD